MPREVNDTGNSKTYIRRDGQGRYTDDQVKVGKSLAADRKRDAKTVAKKGEGDRGDRAN